MRNVSRFMILAVLLFILLPLGPEDIVLTPFLISIMGAQGYLLFMVGIVAYLYVTINGKTFSQKYRTISSEFKKIIG